MGKKKGEIAGDKGSQWVEKGNLGDLGKKKTFKNV